MMYIFRDHNFYRKMFRKKILIKHCQFHLYVNKLVLWHVYEQGVSFFVIILNFIEISSRLAVFNVESNCNPLLEIIFTILQLVQAELDDASNFALYLISKQELKITFRLLRISNRKKDQMLKV